MRNLGSSSRLAHWADGAAPLVGVLAVAWLVLLRCLAAASYSRSQYASARRESCRTCTYSLHMQASLWIQNHQSKMTDPPCLPQLVSGGTVFCSLPGSRWTRLQQCTKSLSAPDISMMIKSDAVDAVAAGSIRLQHAV